MFTVCSNKLSQPYLQSIIHFRTLFESAVNAKSDMCKYESF